MNTKGDFWNDRNRELPNEEKISQWVATNLGGEVTSRPTGYFKEYDFGVTVNGREITYELKTDYYSCDSWDALGGGYIFLETGCNKKDSAILTTEADNWLYYLPNRHQIIGFKPEKMLAYVSGHYCRQQYNVGKKNADGKFIGNANGLLIPQEVSGMSWLKIKNYYG